ncbi:hypothetical protein F2Q69_00031216 [Brassica cretica]|uniref:Uncharacterized protein n=1 Tax=Brassica cretica TaxID=69181 RepID=A0A8S9RUJ1_BRACR|nr:hypothetical protein F2Q69_00031216 [Brassica cretica]
MTLALLTASPPSSLDFSARRPIESMHRRRRLSRSLLILSSSPELLSEELGSKLRDGLLIV